jgi:hypothetical protein
VVSGKWQVGKWLIVTPVLLLFLWSAVDASGGNPDADTGAHEIAIALADAPDGTVLYDHWYSWQWRYHLFDTAVYTAWFPNPAALADELTVFGRDGNVHYLVLPDDATALPVLRAVHEAGFGLELVAGGENGRMVLYRVEGETIDN